MQANYDPINIQHKCSVIIKKPKYIMNDGWSWIIAAVENGKLDENSTEQDIFNLKVELAKENKIRLNQFLRSDNNKKGVLFDPCDYCIDIPYYIIGDNVNKLNGTGGRNYIANDLYSGNDRILNCNVSQDIGSSGQCNIILDNTGDIYTLHNELYYNSEDINLNYGEYILNQGNVCVIEPNDEVEVYMSDWQGNFNCVFTGYVSNVSFSDDGLQKRISLQCDDITKKLNWIYFNAQAGFDVREARGVKLSAYTENQQPLKLNEVVSNILAETYCDIYKRDDFVLKLVKVYANAWTWSNKTNLTTSSLNSAYYRMRDIVLEELKKYVKVQYVHKTIADYEKMSLRAVPINKELGRIGQKVTIDYEKLAEELGNFNEDGYMQTPFVEPDKGELAFKIEGMNQIAWAWTTHNGSYDYLFSNYKKSLDFVREIAGLVQYEFFANPLGVLYFRPPNFNLPRVIGLNKEVDNYIQENYWIDGSKEQYFSNFNTTLNDNKIFTRVNVIGHNKAMNFTHAYLKSACYSPQWYLNKYGLRMMPTTTKVGLLDDDACQTYGELLLHKNNMNYELCGTSCVLNSNYVIGQPIFIRRHFAVWYIGRVSHNFTSGGNCTTELTLTYKRTPMCLDKDLDKYLSDNKAIGKLTETEVDYINKHYGELTWAVLRIKGATISNNVSVGENVSTTKEYSFVWQPLIGRFYDALECLIEEQVNIANNINTTKTKVIRVVEIKKAKKNAFRDLKKQIQYEIAQGGPGQELKAELLKDNPPVKIYQVLEQAITKGIIKPIKESGFRKGIVKSFYTYNTSLGTAIGEYIAINRAIEKYVDVPRDRLRANANQSQWYINDNI